MHAYPKFGCQGLSAHSGLTLVELMVSLALSLLIVLAATSIFVTSQSAYTANDDAALIQESGRYGLEVIARALRQSGYEDWSGGGTAKLTRSDESATIVGLDAKSLKATTAAVDSPVAKSVNGSDVLGIRFHGSGGGDNGDGSMLNCAGFGVGSESKSGGMTDRGWSIFYVAEDSAGEPELRCKYRGKTSWNAVAIVRGVESFQVLYGLDSDRDGLPNHFLTATEVEQLDDKLVLTGADSAARILEKNRKTHWKNIVAVKIALLVRGARAGRNDALRKSYDLFGKEYSDAYGVVDVGTRISEPDLPARSRNRIRKVFSATIMLRNRTDGGGI
ncbi:type IV pilus assembly protein PilW [Paucimonas lemoignei]|uniref:Type IV pilus assembly protein PilW n=1 Tax=Paucimonas lemoignei TaxID=29443 RepID=A0A4R3HSQ6_PAULE|nr:PilW family protein [Paucimonas lemoignei]TCS35704.1 type IV pilus assembly protein PilW [Paucimonas lemoignei]